MGNLSTIIIALVLAAVIGLIIFFMIRNKKKGKSSCSCGCGCEGCSAAVGCGQKRDNKS